eukprot:2840709-Pleurochrysis_carterae.AAC.3
MSWISIQPAHLACIAVCVGMSCRSAAARLPPCLSLAAPSATVATRGIAWCAAAAHATRRSAAGRLGVLTERVRWLARGKAPPRGRSATGHDPEVSTYD